MSKRLFTVYIHISPSNKYYVGITSAKNIENRWGKDGQGYKTQIFYRAIKKYGWNNFKHIIVAKDLIKTEACDLEIKLINKFKSNKKEYGYNISNGGECVNLGLTHTEDARRKISEFLSIPICQYDLNGNLIKRWKSIIEVENTLGFDRSSIAKCCKGKYKTSKNFVWRYEKDNFDKFDLKKYQQKKQRVPVIQYDLDMNFVKEWDSITEASSKLNISTSEISACCKGRRNLAKGYRFKYKNKDNEKENK